MPALRVLARTAAVLAAVCVVFLLSLGAALWVAAGPPPPLPANVAPSEVPVSNPALRADLLRRRAAEQAVRKEIDMSALGAVKSASALWTLGRAAVRMWRVDRPNQQFVRQRVAASGWPTAVEVGRDGMEALFLIVQHGPGDLQRAALGPFRAAWRAGDLDGQSLAMLTDRILVTSGRPQVYGTQIGWGEGGRMALAPVRDAARLDARRAAMGLPPLAEYLKVVCDEMQVCVEPPAAS